MFKIERYQAIPQKDGSIQCENIGYGDVTFKTWVSMKKSVSRLEKALGIQKAFIPGTRWITVHPGGGKGVPVMIRQGKDGDYRIIGGAGGKLNMLKLTNIKSPEEYKKEAAERKEKEKPSEEVKAERKEEKKEVKQEAAKRFRDIIGDQKAATGAVIKQAQKKAEEFSGQVKKDENLKKYVIDQLKGNDDPDNVPDSVRFNKEEIDKNIRLLDESLALKNKLREIDGKRQIKITSLLRDNPENSHNQDAFVNNSFLETTEKLPEYQKREIEGSVGQFNKISENFLGGVGIDQSTVEYLGINATGHAMAKMMKEAYGDQLETIKRASELKHGEDSSKKAKEKLSEIKDLLNGHDSEVTVSDLSTSIDALNLKKLQKDKIRQAGKLAGNALGEMSSHAALNYGLDVVDSDIEIEVPEESLKERGFESGEYEYKDGKATLKGESYKKLFKPFKAEEVATDLEVSLIKRGDRDEKGWLPAGVVSRSSDSFDDPGESASKPKESLNEQTIPETAETKEAVHRALGDTPEAIIAYKDELTSTDRTVLRDYWLNNVYKGTRAEAEEEGGFQKGQAISKNKAWSDFEKGDKERAYQDIKSDMKGKGMEDMYGNKTYNPLYYVADGQWETYKSIPEAAEVFRSIDSFEHEINTGLVKNQDAAEKELQRMKDSLPDQLNEIYNQKMRDYYHDSMSPYTKEQYEAANQRQEGSPWDEFTRMYGGDSDKAMESIKDHVKRKFNNDLLKSYRSITKTGLHTEIKDIANKRDFLLGSLGREDRDKWMTRAQKEMAQAGATVANRENGKFAEGSWRDKAIELMSKDSKQKNLFEAEDLKQDDGLNYVSFGQKADNDVKNLVQKLGKGRNPQDRYEIKPGMNMDGKYAVQQRAVKMFEKVQKMNLTFGTGQGKSITSIGAFTNLKDKGRVKRAIFATPSAVVKQFGGEVLKYTEPGRYKYSTSDGKDREERLSALRGDSDMVVMTHQSVRDDMIHLLSKDFGDTEEATKERFNAMTPEERKAAMKSMMTKEGIDFGMFVIDESHYDTDREGKVDSTMSNVFDAIRDNSTHYMRQSATPVKNDLSEVLSMLQKTDPEKFGGITSKEFEKTYSKGGEINKRALQRLVHRYNYASPTETGVKRISERVDVKLKPDQVQRHDRVLSLIEAAKEKRLKNRIPLAEMKELAPDYFPEGLSEKQEKAIAKDMMRNTGVLKQRALNEVVNTSGGAKLEKIGDIVSKHIYEADHKNGKKGSQQPGVVFAYNLESVKKIKESMEKKGLRVGVITGDQNSTEKAKTREGFNPTDPKNRKYDIVVASDAGATGLNLQNAKFLINYDLPNTAWVKKQREGRIDRHGQAHDEINYYDLVSDTDYDRTNWERIQRKAALGDIFEKDPGEIDDTGILSKVKVA